MSRRPIHVPATRLLGLLALAAACTPALRLGREAAPGAIETWIVARDAAVAAGVTAPTAPALALATHAHGTPTAPEVPRLDQTRIKTMLVGPIATIERTKTYAAAGTASDGFVCFTPPGAPARQDYLVRLGRRTFAILVRDPVAARELVRTRPGATLVDAAADGRILVPAGPIGSKSAELTVETIGLVPWRDGAYELTVPRATEGEVILEADVYGPGPIVVVSSPSHAIDAAPQSVEHLRVALRDPGTLRDLRGTSVAVAW